MAIAAAYAVPHPPLIIPDVGLGREKEIQSTINAYDEVSRRIADLKPDTIVVVSPHAPAYRDGFYVAGAERANGTMQQFGVWDVAVGAPCDAEFATRLADNAVAAGLPTVKGSAKVENLDHATTVPLWFINKGTEAYGLVTMGISGLPYEAHRTMGQAVAKTARELGRKTVFVASGDLSHCLKEDGPYGFKPQGMVYDREIMDLFDTGDLEGLFAMDRGFVDEADQCGLGSFQVMAGALEGTAHTHEVLSYEGPFGVGYGVACFEVLDDTPESEEAPETVEAHPDDREMAQAQHADELADEEPVDPFVALARRAVEAWVQGRTQLPVPQDLPPELSEVRAATFVSLHEGGDLRGCIGTIVPTCGNVAEEIIQNAISACSRDPRFIPVRPEELDALSYSVDVLFPPMPIDSTAELDPARYGVIVSQGAKRGLLLPNLEGVDTVEMQVAIAKQKAGIAVNDNNVRLERFEVVRHDRGGEARKA